MSFIVQFHNTNCLLPQTFGIGTNICEGYANISTNELVAVNIKGVRAAETFRSSIFKKLQHSLAGLVQKLVWAFVTKIASEIGSTFW